MASTKGETERENRRLQGLLNWLRHNPLKSGVVVGAASILGSFSTIYFQNIFIPSLMPLNVITKISTRNPSRQKAYVAQNGTTFSPLELAATVENPGSRKLYLLRTAWVAEVCSIVDLKNESNKGSAATAGAGLIKIVPNFEESVESNNKAYTTNISHVYKGYNRVLDYP